MSNKVQIEFMLNKLEKWNEQLGGKQAKKSLATSQFDYLQEQFLAKRHFVQSCQDRKEIQGITKDNAQLGFEIRQGLQSMKQLVGKLKQQYQRLFKKKKDSPQILERKRKIVQNCQLLMKDIEQRQNGIQGNYKNKAVTLTDMKAKLLAEIDDNYEKIHRGGSDGELSEQLNDDEDQIRKFKQKDKEMDVMVDDIITGVKGIKNKVKMINEQQDTINKKTKQGTKKVDEVNERIRRDNDKLKQIIQKFKPNRCCLFVALFLLFTGLVVCIIKLLI